jgi:hypothetical protein
VKIADVKIAGEQASSVPIQVIGDPAFPAPAAACTSASSPNLSTLNKLMANGILGVGLGRHDCGTCTGFYFACSSASNCQETATTLPQQVQNPVWLFPPPDNNGVLVQLPAIAPGAPSASGSLIFGIGTQSNNALGNATILDVDSHGSITTTFNGTAHPGSFIDSGSNGIFFLNQTDTGMPPCSGSATDFYCPTAPSTRSFTATHQARSGPSTVNFSVTNAQTLFNSSNRAFSQLAGPNPGIFDWGLPFFFGRTVFTAIVGQNTPAGPGPYVAY